MFEKSGVEDCVAPSDAIRFATRGEFASGVGARRIEQPIVGRFVDDGRGYQGFCNQARDCVNNVRLVYFRLGRKRAGGLTREAPDKDGQPAQNYLLALRKQAVTPIEHRVQGLVPRQRRTATLPEQAEAIVKQLRGSTYPKGADATGRELNGKCHSVKPAAAPGDDRRIDIAQRRAIAARPRPPPEKLGRRVLERFPRA